MFDLTPIFVISSLLFSLIVGNAALYGDTLKVRIAVPESLQSSGFNEATAEEVFTAQAAKIVRAPSIIPAPALRIHSSPSVIAALAKPLSLDAVVTALQSQFGIDNLMVAGALLAEIPPDKPSNVIPVRPLTKGIKIDFVLVVTQKNEVPVQTVLEQEDGDVAALVMRGAAWAMEQVSPYRVVLTYAIDGMLGDPQGLPRAQAAAQALLAKPWDRQRASEIALTHDVLALIDMNSGDLNAADRELALAQPLPNVMPAARTLIALNRCFLAVAMKQPREAAEYLRVARSFTGQFVLPNFDIHLQLLEGLVAWSGGDPAKAEEMFRALLEKMSDNDTAHHYLSLLFKEHGDATAALQQEHLAQTALPNDGDRQALAVDLFWTDPVNGGVVRRR